jgi:glutamine---fructose-6-phosphate transaminase (isomerizing)
MCGIVGYLGKRNPASVIIDGLSKLEYRGYDSAGIAFFKGSELQLFRSEGKLSRLKSLLQENGSFADSHGEIRVGLGHTRWATHGRPTETNAHPHLAGDICVVHNGIIENYSELRTDLQARGRVFRSETDTEIVAHLIDEHRKNTKTLREAVRKSIAELRGSYALVVLSKKDPDQLITVKNATPVVIGLGEGENFIASDIPAILPYTRSVYILEDGDLAEVTASSIIVERDGKEVSFTPQQITWDPVTAEKGGFRHFMLKEIYEQPQAITQTFRSRILQETGEILLEDVILKDQDFKDIDRVLLVACGTARHAALVTKYYLEEFTGLPVEVDYGSEFRYRKFSCNEKTLCIAVSQSGETADTLGSLIAAKEAGAKTMAICNVVGSTIARKAESVFYTHAGPEISVASTKAFVTQLTAGFLLALAIGRIRGTLSADQVRTYFSELLKIPAIITETLTLDRQIEKIARKYGKTEHFLYLGRGSLFPVALEGALKLKEISYVHAEGYPAGEMKHGPIALIGEETPVVVVIGHDGVNYDKTMSNLKEVEARGGRIIAITDTPTDQLKELSWEILSTGAVPSLLLPIALTIPLQLLAYHVAIYRGTDVDQPRNLAKSVTVE